MYIHCSFICKLIYWIILTVNTSESLLDIRKIFREPHTFINESGSYTRRIMRSSLVLHHNCINNQNMKCESHKCKVCVGKHRNEYGIVVLGTPMRPLCSC